MTRWLLLLCMLFATACESAPAAPIPSDALTESAATGRTASAPPAPASTAVSLAPTASGTLAPAPQSTLPPTATVVPTQTPTPTRTPTPTPKPPNPLEISAMRAREYAGSDLTIEDALAPGANYQRYYASYKSDGLKIYGLLTVPNGAKPATGWPVVIFNHGFIPPTVYKTTERYIAYTDAFSRNGYIVFKSDYRGHDRSEGSASGGYGSPDYTVDVLNAVGSLKHYKDADPNRIGMWGHSMGGQITLRAVVVTKGIKAAVIWGGVVAPYPDIMFNWRTIPGASPTSGRTAGWRGALLNEYGSPADNPDFWASISPNSYLAEGVPPIQIHHSVTDEEVPFRFGQTLADEMKQTSQTYEFYSYSGDDHNISGNLFTALARSVAWFDKYVKATK